MLDPQLKKLLDQLDALKTVELYELPVSKARQVSLATVELLNGRPMAIHRTHDQTIPGPGGNLAIRIYQPRETSLQKPLPVLLFFHGGGWVLGSVDSCEIPCRYLANESDCMVVSVGYRLAPEHPFPAAVEDAVAATKWVYENISSLGGDPKRLAVAGESAGGNLAAVLAQELKRQAGPQLCLQILLYPLTEFLKESPSREKYGEGYFLTQAHMRWFRELYIQEEKDYYDFRASPGLNPELNSLPPAMIITAGYDPIGDDGRNYAKQLTAAGVNVEHIDYEDMVHGFISMSNITDRAKEALQQCARALRRAFT